MSLQVLVAESGSPLDGKNVDLAGDSKGRLRLAPSATWGAATITTSVGGAALGGAAAYGAGVLVTNLDSAISIYLAPSAVELAAAASRYTLAPGASVVIPFGSLAGIFAAAVSGTPQLSFIGAS